MSDWPLPIQVVATIAFVAIFLLIVANAFTPTDEGPSVSRYCAYGAVSQAQMEGCLEHVTPAYVQAADTNAGSYGRKEITSCLEDAGPYCMDLTKDEPEGNAWDHPGP